MAPVIRGSRHVSRITGREGEIPALMWAGALFVVAGASLASGWHTAALNQLLPQSQDDPGAMINGEPLTPSTARRRLADGDTSGHPLRMLQLGAQFTAVGARLPPQRFWRRPGPPHSAPLQMCPRYHLQRCNSWRRP